MCLRITPLFDQNNIFRILKPSWRENPEVSEDSVVDVSENPGGELER